MTNRWGILGLLFLVRTAMAVQFESVPALSPILQREFQVGLPELGLLIGVYLLPGILISIPGGAIGRALGDKRALLLGCLVMIGGSLVMAFGHTWHTQIAGRLLTGTGGVLLNIITSKAVVDWFAGEEIATALALLINSWPFGIALALLVLPPLGATLGYVPVFLTAAAFVALGAIGAAFSTPTAGRRSRARRRSAGSTGAQACSLQPQARSGASSIPR